jgi:putative acetyltransferase
MIALRPAQPADAEPLGRLFTASRAALDFLPRLHTPDADMAFIAAHILPNHKVTVAESDGVIAGYMAESPGWIEQLYVHPSQFRRGVGSSLLRDAMARNDALELWCFAENRRGRALYEKHGFVELLRTDGMNNEERAPDIRYRWQR